MAAAFLQLTKSLTHTLNPSMMLQGFKHCIITDTKQQKPDKRRLLGKVAPNVAALYMCSFTRPAHTAANAAEHPRPHKQRRVVGWANRGWAITAQWVVGSCAGTPGVSHNGTKQMRHTCKTHVLVAEPAVANIRFLHCCSTVSQTAACYKDIQRAFLYTHSAAALAPAILTAGASLALLITPACARLCASSTSTAYNLKAPHTPTVMYNPVQGTEDTPIHTHRVLRTLTCCSALEKTRQCVTSAAQRAASTAAGWLKQPSMRLEHLVQDCSVMPDVSHPCPHGSQDILRQGPPTHLLHSTCHGQLSAH